MVSTDRVVKGEESKVFVPARQIPSFLTHEAQANGVLNKFMINTWGGLGDQICAEPAIRFALKNFPKCEVSLASECPELFEHLKFKEVFDTRKVRPVPENYMNFYSIRPPTDLLWEFCCHMLTHCVDFPTICMWRSTLPHAEKEIQLPDFLITEKIRWSVNNRYKTVVVHPGKHWPSKTFPKEWWDAIIQGLVAKGFKPTLIGKRVDDNRGYVDVSNKGCIDLRDELDIKEMIALLKNCESVLTNDSSPIHAAAAGDAFIGFVASCKHPDYIMHWRQGKFGYKMKNFGLDGSWNHIDQNPAQEKQVTIEEMPEGLMEKILPPPGDVVDFYFNKKWI